MPVHGNPANRHARTTRLSHSRWAISGTHPANRREFGDPFCSVLFCSVHTLGCHTWTTRFSKTHAEPPHTDGPNLKTIHSSSPFPNSQFNSCQFNFMHQEFLSCNSTQIQTIVRHSQHAVYPPDLRKNYLPRSLHFCIICKKTRNPHLYFQCLRLSGCQDLAYSQRLLDSRGLLLSC